MYFWENYYSPSIFFIIFSDFLHLGVTFTRSEKYLFFKNILEILSRKSTYFCEKTSSFSDKNIFLAIGFGIYICLYTQNLRFIFYFFDFYKDTMRDFLNSRKKYFFSHNFADAKIHILIGVVFFGVPEMGNRKFCSNVLYHFFKSFLIF